MSTLLTVGYGDIYPITTLGRIMAICIAYLGVGVVAIPTGIMKNRNLATQRDMLLSRLMSGKLEV